MERQTPTQAKTHILGWRTARPAKRRVSAMTDRPLVALLASLVLVACGQPIAPVVEDVKGVGLLSDAEIASVAEQISESSDVKLPSLNRLLRASREAINAGSGDYERAVRHFRAAKRLANRAEDSIEAGNEEEAKKLRRRSYGHRLQGVVATLGEDAVAGAIAGSEGGLTRLQARLSGRDISERAAKKLAKIAEHAGKSQVMLSSGKSVRALHYALSAADGIRHFSPRYRARKQIGRAKRVIKQAISVVGDTPTEEEAKSIRRARKLLGKANEEYKARKFDRAHSAAKRSARLSWGVVNGRAG